MEATASQAVQQCVSELGPGNIHELSGLPFPFPGNTKARRREVVCLNSVETSGSGSWAVSSGFRALGTFRCGRSLPDLVFAWLRLK